MLEDCKSISPVGDAFSVTCAKAGVAVRKHTVSMTPTTFGESALRKFVISSAARNLALKPGSVRGSSSASPPRNDTLGGLVHIPLSRRHEFTGHMLRLRTLLSLAESEFAIHRQVLPLLLLAIGPADFYAIDDACFPQSEMQPRIARGKVAFATAHFIRLGCA